MRPAPNAPVSRAEFELLCQMIEIIGVLPGGVFDRYHEFRPMLTDRAQNVLDVWAGYRSGDGDPIFAGGPE